MPTPESFVLPVINPRPAKRLPYFKEHPRPGPGRAKGSHNKVPYDLKRDLVEAAAEVGFDGEGEQGLKGYLKHLAIRHPKCFSNLLGKVLPLQANVDVNASVASIGELRIISVPTDHYFIPDANGSPSVPGTLKHIPPSELIAPIKQAEPAPVEGIASQSSEEEIIQNLKTEINELARRAGLSLVV